MNTLLLVALVVEAVAGLGFVLAPDPVLAALGAKLDDLSRSFARLFGSALLGLAIVLGFAYRLAVPELRAGVAWSLSVYYLVSAALIAGVLRKGLMKPAGWGMAVLHVALAAGFLYFLATA